MHFDLKHDLASIRVGFDAQASVTQRAAAILAMDARSAKSYELALEAEALQEAEAENRGLFWREGEAGQEEWLLDRQVWAAMAVQAHRVRRSFWMPAGATADQAAAEARRIYHNAHINAADVFCADRAAFAMAAE